ncbi:hypothetical protein CHARACLAT_025001 [Characodon lateralis]|uniref:Uncharacterized protein n=1 Tax=Characodon lateralis TaxID=208331 RepID=A0ABU7EXQ3_9TELE|nr:hypothetical protein [Characodon lateralis]
MLSWTELLDFIFGRKNKGRHRVRGSWRSRNYVVSDDRSLERDSSFLTPALGKEAAFLSTPLLPILSSTPAASSEMSSPPTTGDSTSSSCVSIRKRRRLAASPGGLHWNSEAKLRSEPHSKPQSDMILLNHFISFAHPEHQD